MHSVSRRTLSWDLEFGDFLLRSIARGVWCNGRGSTLSIDMMFVGFRGMIVKGFDNLIWVDLVYTSTTEYKADGLHWNRPSLSGYIHGVREP